MARLVVENGHKQNTCYYEIELCAHHILTIKVSLVSTIGRVSMAT